MRRCGHLYGGERDGVSAFSSKIDPALALTKAASAGFLEGSALATHRAPILITLFLEKSGGAAGGNLRLQHASPA